MERARTEFSKVLGSHYVVQDYIPHGQLAVPMVQGDHVDWRTEYFILGAYVIGGECVAIEAKTKGKLPVTMNVSAARRGVE